MFWFRGSVAEAINKSKIEKKVFVVFINGTDDLSKKMNDMYESLSNKLSSLSLVAIKLEAQSDNCKLFSQIYPVLVIPSTYFIDLNGVAIEIIGGSVDSEQDLIDKIEKIIEIFKKSVTSSEVQPTPDSNETTSSPSTSSPTTRTSNSSSVDVKTEPKDNTSASSASSSLPVSESATIESATNESATIESTTIESKVERANQLIEAIRQKKAKEEEQKAKSDEIERRKGLKELQKSKQIREEKEAQEVIQLREKEKREEKLARERVLAQIAADREERRARQKVFTSSEEQSSSSETQPLSSPSSSGTVRSRTHDKARIQFRLPDGSTRNHEFGANDKLESVRQYLISNLSYNDFILSTTFPRKEFTAIDYNQSLQQLCLSPSSALLVIPNKGINTSRAVTSPTLFWQLLSLLFSPFLMMWNFMRRLFGSSDASETSEPNIPDFAKNMNKKPKTFYSKEGNVARIRDPMKEDDDDNNTWNGNSTQQM